MPPRTATMDAAPRNRALAASPRVGASLRLRSVAYVGEWPRGVYWQPGEERTIAPERVADEGPPPAGLEPVAEEG